MDCRLGIHGNFYMIPGFPISAKTKKFTFFIDKGLFFEKKLRNEILEGIVLFLR